MKTYHKLYSGYKKEYFEMRNLLSESCKVSDKPLNWWVGRLDDWRFASYTAKIKDNPRYYQENSHLWRNENDELIGFFISEDGKNYFEIQVHPEYRYIEKEMLKWIFGNWAQTRDKIVTCIYGWNEDRAKLLTDCGFESKGLEAVDFRYDTSKYSADEVIDPDYHFETFSDNYNYENHIETQRLAFGRTKDQLNREWFETKCMAPGYSSDLDFIVVDSKGDHLAFCVAWMDKSNQIAEIDPVGTHPDFRKKGLAKAVIKHCFISLQKKGIKKVQILGFTDVPKRLYRSLKPVEEHEIIRFELTRNEN